MVAPVAASAKIGPSGRSALNADAEVETVSTEREHSEKMTFVGVMVWLLKSGAWAVLAVAVFGGIFAIGSIWSDTRWQGERQAAQYETHKADMARINARNGIQDEKLAEIPVILERNETVLTLFKEQTENTLTQLVEKVNGIDTFLRINRDSASMDGKGSAKNVSTCVSM